MVCDNMHMAKTPKGPKMPKLAQLPKPQPGSIGESGNRLGDRLPTIGRSRRVPKA